jgi:8-oxo-dGTP pyrophosphatase MutT (NUDIX family)
LVPLYWEADRWNVLYTLRTEHVDAHRGQVSFPGGRIEPGDSGPQAAALREAEEEIGIRPQDVRLLGLLDSLLTVTQLRWAGRQRHPGLPLRVSTRGGSRSASLDWLSDPKR